MEPTKKPKGWSTWSTGKKVLVVILGGVGLFFVFGAALFAYGIYWLYGAGEQTDPKRVVGPSTEAYAHQVKSLEDPGLRATLDHFEAGYRKLQQQRTANQDDIPAPMRTLMELSQGQSGAQFGMFFPRNASFALQDAAGDDIAIAVNPRGMGGFIKGFFKMMTSQLMADPETGEKPFTSEEYREHEIVGDADFAASHHGSTLLFASSKAGVRAVIDRILDEAPVAMDPALKAMDQKVAPGSDLYLVARHAPSQLFDQEIDGLAAVGIGVDVVDADRWTVRLLVDCASPEDLPATSDLVRVQLQQLARDLARDGVTLSGMERPQQVGPASLRLDLEARGFEDAIDRLLQETLAPPAVVETCDGAAPCEPE